MNRKTWLDKQAADKEITTGKTAPPLLVSGILHILNPRVSTAIEKRDTVALENIVRQQLGAGAQALAVNLGPGREIGRHTGWVVDTIRGITDVSLFFSANILEHPDVLSKYGQAITVNAVTANQEEVSLALERARRYGCSVVVLLVRSGENTAGVHSKIKFASEVLEKAYASDFPRERLYFDPVLSCHHDPLAWRISRGRPDIGAAVETISLISQLDTGVKTIVALGNLPGTDTGVRSSMYSILADAGVDAVLVNTLDGSVPYHVHGAICEQVSFSSAT